MDENLANSEREAFESQTPSLYTGSGKGKEKGKAKGFLKRKGPIGLIIGLIFGAGGLIGGSQMMQPFSLIEQYRETFNSMQTSARMRSGSFMRYQMDPSRTKNPIKGKIFGENTFKITDKQKKLLAAQGIEYDENYKAPNGETARVLKYDDGNMVHIIAADLDTVRRLGGIGAPAIDFDGMYENDPDFFNGYNKASMTWRGAIANWFDTATVKFLRSNKITRNLFQDFQRRVDAENNGNTRAGALDMMARGADEITERGYATRGEENRIEMEEPVLDAEGNIQYDDNGKVITRKIYPYVPTDVSNRSASSIAGEASEMYDKVPGHAAKKTKKGNTVYDVLKTDMSSSVSGGGTIERSSMTTEAEVETKLKDVAGKVQKGANIACTMFNVLGSIGMLVTASETLQVINLVTSYFEAIDKVKAGNGSDSPVHDLTNALNEKKVNEHEVLTSVSSSNGSRNVSATTTSHNSEKSAMESSGIVALYSGGTVDPKDPSVQSFNFSGNLGTIFGGLGTSLALFESCGIAKVAANTVSAITDAVEVAGCILGAVGAAFTLGVSAAACGALATKVITGIGFSVAIAVAVSAVVAALVPTVAKVLTRDLITNIGGEDLGNALTSGANMYMGSTHRANGGSLANANEYTKFAVAQQAVIADNAKYERQNRDPFDATSKYTFMGTLMGQLMKFSTVSSVMSVVTSMSSSVSSSIIAMNSSTASAYDISAHLPDPAEYEKTCPYLASIGAVGDAFCNPLIITDTSTIDMNPVDVINQIDSWGGFLSTDAPDKNVQIDGSSDLAKYILYCDNRASTFGITDWNIVNEVSNWGSVNTSSSFVNTVTNGAIGAVPVIGDVIDVVSNEQALANAGYVSGESCVAGNTVDKSESPNWEKAKYYQRFIEDQSLAETIGLFGDEGKSAVTAFLDEYYEEHPLDNSYEGILARYSGLTKDDVVALLDFIEYETYVANYDPSERYVFDDSLEIDEEKTISFADENEERFYNIWWYNNIYDRVGRVKTRAEKTEYTVC